MHFCIIDKETKGQICSVAARDKLMAESVTPTAYIQGVMTVTVSHRNTLLWNCLCVAVSQLKQLH